MNDRRKIKLAKRKASCYDKSKGGVQLVNSKLIGKVIREFRQKKGISQEVLSGLADLSRTHYSMIERGLGNPTIEALFKIASALDIPPHDILIAIEKAVEEKEKE